MSRGFWGGMMLAALLVTSGAAYVVYSRVQEKAPLPVALKPVPETQTPVPVESAPMDTSSASEPAASSATATAPRSTSVKKKPAPSAAPEMTEASTSNEDGTRNISFRFHGPNAKNVALIGDFSQWKRKNLNKDGKEWSLAMKLKPGTYNYLYIVDGRRTKDPNNKTVSEDGQSVLVVKALTVN